MFALSSDWRTAKLVDAYTSLRPDNLHELLALYAPQATFKDPFNEVQGTDAIARIFRQMFDELHAPRFVVLVAVTEGEHAFLTWEFHFLRKAGGQAMTVRGASHIRYSAAGLVTMHRDYWDVAEELYAKLPLLGGLMRFLGRRLSTPQVSGPAVVPQTRSDG